MPLEARSNLKRIFLDTNLLVLLVVGLYDRDLIPKHRRTSSYQVEDFDLLLWLLGDRQVLVTPNVLTEASNLLRYDRRSVDRRSAGLLALLAQLLQPTGTDRYLQEEFVPSDEAAREDCFVRLGLADTVATHEAYARESFLTDDLGLYLELAGLNRDVVNFTHERKKSWSLPS